MMTSNEIRQKFLDYFIENGHMVEPGASLIPINDPTLLWVNSGVSALKKYFDGREKPRSNRICNVQKSIRTNDIENVGYTARHHTFFEMLGNFSIGDYFKREAIHFAFEFLTSSKWMNFDPEKLYISVYTEDEEAYRIWVDEIKIPEQRILKSPDNFWQIGDGPCGPNTEIFYDRGSAFDPEEVGERLFFEDLENDRYIEVWNVVFSQFDGKEGVDRHLFKELPQKNIDTGMGFERLVSIVQKGETNYDTDLFLPIIRATEKIAGVPYSEHKLAYRVIADHVRTVTFALGDGALFANEGRGYVLRRVLRRAVRYGRKIGITSVFLYDLVDCVIEGMQSFYPNLLESRGLIKQLVKAEEERFLKTLSAGESMLSDALASTEGQTLDGKTAFKLYDTYGFPFELTQEIASESGFSVDSPGFEEEMKKQQERARNARTDVESMFSQSKDLLEFKTESSFIGYTDSVCEARVIGIFKDGKQLETLTDGGQLIFDQTVFYAESGGQVADTGVIKNPTTEMVVTDVQKAPHGQFMHSVTVHYGSVSIGDQFTLKIDRSKRLKIMKNHSSAHLLQAALKEVVGTHIHQAGSFVSETYMRFDFTHFEKVNDEQLKAIEQIVNMWVSDSYPVTIELLPIDIARQSGATALFDEKYGDIVRVVTMGDVSKEFCGGTHVSNTSELGVFKIISEESIGSGTRRIVAKTSFAAYEVLKESEDLIEVLLNELNINSRQRLLEKVIQQKELIESLSLENTRMVSKQLDAAAKEYVATAVSYNDLQLILFETSQISSEHMKELVEKIRHQCKNSFVLGILNQDDRIILVAASSDYAISKGFMAGKLVKEAAVLAGGNGGGRNDFAQAGGRDSSNNSLIFETIRNKFSKYL